MLSLADGSMPVFHTFVSFGDAFVGLIFLMMLATGFHLGFFTRWVLITSGCTVCAGGVALVVGGGCVMSANLIYLLLVFEVIVATTSFIFLSTIGACIMGFFVAPDG